jgi:hypothetical protein
LNPYCNFFWSFFKLYGFKGLYNSFSSFKASGSLANVTEAKASRESKYRIGGISGQRAQNFGFESPFDVTT